MLDTRKTTPGQRVLEKYAVRVGGCHNHRAGLDDGILIKENHIRAAGGITAAVARRAAPHRARCSCVEVEVTNLAELDEAIAAGAEVVLVDNADLDGLRAAVARPTATPPARVPAWRPAAASPWPTWPTSPAPAWITSRSAR